MSRPTLACIVVTVALPTLIACSPAPAADGPLAAGLPPVAAGWGTGAPWNDGLAELSVYSGTVPRYGTSRPVELRLVAVAEDLDASTLVKSDHPASTETLRVLKMNLKRRFTTGVYDYDQMTSVFLDASTLRLVKETFTHHELCGNAFSILEAPAAGEPVTVRAFSYFDGFAETSGTYERADLLTPEALLLALRGVPREEGWTRTIALLPSPAEQVWRPGPPGAATVRVAGIEDVTTGLGVLRGRLVEVRRAAGTDRLWFDEARGGRLLRYESAEGMQVRLDWSDRMAYWRENRPGDEALLTAAPPAR